MKKLSEYHRAKIRLLAKQKKLKRADAKKIYIESNKELSSSELIVNITNILKELGVTYMLGHEIPKRNNEKN